MFCNVILYASYSISKVSVTFVTLVVTISGGEEHMDFNVPEKTNNLVRRELTRVLLLWNLRGACENIPGEIKCYEGGRCWILLSDRIQGRINNMALKMIYILRFFFHNWPVPWSQGFVDLGHLNGVSTFTALVQKVDRQKEDIPSLELRVN